MTRYRTLEFDSAVATAAPLVHHAMPYIAHTAIRTRGTAGGSLAYADPAAELPAVTMALGARYRAISAQGERWIAAEDFFLDQFVTALTPEEILTEITIPAMPAHSGWGFYECARRHGDRVMMGAAAVVTLDREGACTERTAGLPKRRAHASPGAESRGTAGGPDRKRGGDRSGRADGGV